MSISSLLIHTRPEDVPRVRDSLNAQAGVEVHADTPEGRIVVTVDEPDNSRAADILQSFRELDGVLNTSLVYTYFDEETAEVKREHAA